MSGLTSGRIAASAAVILSLGLMLAAGCNKGQESGGSDSSGGATSGGPASGGPGMMSGGPGGSGGRMGGPGGPGGGPVAADASGADIYKAKCGCHGPGGKGGRAPVLTGGAGKSVDELIKIIHDGKGRMPAFGSQLSDEQIKKVATEVKGFS